MIRSMHCNEAIMWSGCTVHRIHCGELFYKRCTVKMLQCGDLYCRENIVWIAILQGGSTVKKLQYGEDVL